MARSLLLVIGIGCMAFLPSTTSAWNYKLTTLHRTDNDPPGAAAHTSGISGDCVSISQPAGVTTKHSNLQAEDAPTVVKGPQTGTPCSELQTAVLLDCDSDCGKCEGEIEKINIVLGGCAAPDGSVAATSCAFATTLAEDAPTVAKGPQTGTPCSELQTAVLLDCDSDCGKCEGEIEKINIVLGGCAAPDGSVATTSCAFATEKDVIMSESADAGASLTSGQGSVIMAESYTCDGSSTVIHKVYTDEACTEELPWVDVVCGTRGCGAEQGDIKTNFDGKLSTKGWSTLTEHGGHTYDMKLGTLEGCPFYSSTTVVVGAAAGGVALLGVAGFAAGAVWRRRQRHPNQQRSFEGERGLLSGSYH